LLINKNKDENIELQFCYYKLQNNTFLYYLKFLSENEKENEYEEYIEMILLLNTDDKYICIGQEVYHLFIYTDKFWYDESDGNEGLLFDYKTKLDELEKNTLLEVAIKLIFKKYQI